MRMHARGGRSGPLQCEGSLAGRRQLPGHRHGSRILPESLQSRARCQRSRSGIRRHGGRLRFLGLTAAAVPAAVQHQGRSACARSIPRRACRTAGRRAFEGSPPAAAPGPSRSSSCCAACWCRTTLDRRRPAGKGIAPILRFASRRPDQWKVHRHRCRCTSPPTSTRSSSAGDRFRRRSSVRSGCRAPTESGRRRAACSTARGTGSSCSPVPDRGESSSARGCRCR